MSKKGLFRKDIEPRCIYCAFSGPLDEQYATCRRRGVVALTDHCRAFRYDALRRVPPRPAILRSHYSDADFALEDNDDQD